MNLETVTCNNCGAPLDVPAGARFVTCTHCQARLEVHRDASVVYTEKVAEIADNTHRMADDLAELRHNSDVEQAVRQWERGARWSMLRDSKGRPLKPPIAPFIGIAIIMGMAGVVFAVIWIGTAWQFSGPMAMFGVLFLIGLIPVTAFMVLTARLISSSMQRAREQGDIYRSKFGSLDGALGDRLRRPPPGVGEPLDNDRQQPEAQTPQSDRS
jgi:LSD1 subclass zinc finger protein